ncbi:MAG: transforming growth factor-beta-induced protein [bacterium]|jgi:uncharacterized surface protein with fasciclin (FAS1) repeats
MNNKKYLRVVFAGALVLGMAACSESGVELLDPVDKTQPANLGPDNLVNTAVGAGSFNTLAAALAATGLDVVLADSERNFTVFAPTDEAFADLGQDTINSLLNDTERLSDILLYHVLADTVVDAATAIALAGQSVDAANGDPLSINVEAGDLFINMSKVTTGDVGASNGIIHVIDKVLLPPIDIPADDSTLPNIVETAAAAESFNTLVTALQATGLDATLSGEGPFTVFAPTDAAFSLLGDDAISALLNDTETLSDILLYHVISGQAVDSTTAISLAGQSVQTANTDSVALSLKNGNLLVNNATVIITDIVSSNGIIHVIDLVLTPPTDEVVSGNESEQAQNTIYEAAKTAGLDTFVAAAEIAGLKDALNHPDDVYTVFAPSEAAFTALGSDKLTALVNDPDTLRNILLYHVLPGTSLDAARATELVGIDIGAGNGTTLQLSLRSDGLYIQESRISITDIPAVNGIIHVIDAVLIP